MVAEGASSMAVRNAKAEAHTPRRWCVRRAHPAEEPKKRRERSKQSHAAHAPQEDKRKRRRNVDNPSAAPDGPAALGHTYGSGADVKA